MWVDRKKLVGMLSLFLISQLKNIIDQSSIEILLFKTTDVQTSLVLISGSSRTCSLAVTHSVLKSKSEISKIP